ncbi:MAG: protein kinase [Gemmatimonadetes bacterium]|nr:protein kinase [Gemmatimonadota bacterium]MCB9519005.1 protein kinase [Gemmatimonadales bacterium]HPF61835.1 serine/threonine-protein kinase [Gemmatimonadales bacterium]HRX18550.1 serine/threonine-protein kinase [Gemmatimonadales bacterium]
MADDILERLGPALSDRYAIERRIGQGGMATVYLAEDLKHHRRVAIKVLRPELSASLGIERFLREIEMAAKLQHPHVVPVYDSGSADGVLYYVMPFVEGESLRDLLQREGRIPVARAAAIIREAASGLAYAHAQGIVHRDIKPENIMLSGGHAVVADFGIARAVDASREDGNLTGAGIAIGTPAYMSPEQATADTVDARSDQYALACVFYEMVTGKQAFSGPTMQAMLTSMLTGPRPKLSSVVADVPPGVDGATQRALATDPNARFASITEFADAVLDEGSGVAAATRESQRWKRLAIILPASVTLAAVVWMVFFAGPPRSVVLGAESIAVVPFTTSGPGLDGVGEGMVDLLTGALDGVGAIDAVDPRTVVREWRRRVQDGPGDLQDALAVARASKAASVLLGSIVSTGSTARLTATLHDLDGSELSRASVDGPADSVLALSNALALALLRDIWRSREPLPSANASGIRSNSVPAIRAYLTGERYHRRGMWDSAQAAFEEAVADDSTFALAWFRLANTLGWKGVYQGGAAREAAAKAVQYSDSLPPRLRSLLYASNLFNLADNAAIDSAASYTRMHPGDADGWYLLGEAQYHARSYRPKPPAELRQPFDRVLEIDSSLTQAAIHPLELAILTEDTTLISRYARVFQSAGAETELARVALARRALAGSDSAIVAMFGDAIGQGVAFSALQARLAAMRGAEALDLGAYLQQGLVGTPNGPQFQVVTALLAAGLGRVDTARTLLQASGIAGGTQGSYVGLIPALGGFEYPARLERFDSAFSAVPAPNQYLAVWHGLVMLERGKPREAQALARRLLAAPDSLRSELRGSLAVLDGLTMVALGDTAAGVARIDAGLETIGSSLTMTPFTVPLQLRAALLDLQIPARRQAGLARLRWGFPNSPEMAPIIEYRLGQHFDRTGQPDSAVAHLGRFVDLWDAPDSSYAPLVQDARATIARLSGEAPVEDTLGTARP